MTMTTFLEARDLQSVTAEEIDMWIAKDTWQCMDIHLK